MIHPLIASLLFINFQVPIFNVCSFTIDRNFKRIETVYHQNKSRNHPISDETLSKNDDVSAYIKIGQQDHKVSSDVTYRSNVQIQSILEDSKLSNNQSTCDSAAIEVENILIDLEQKNQADTITYNAVIHALARSNIPDKAQRVHNILQRMENKYQRQMTSHIINTSNVNDRTGLNFEFPAQLMDDEQRIMTVKPNVRTYSSVIDAFAKSTSMDRTEAAEAAQQILERLRHLYKTTGDLDLKPNTICYNSVINCWAKTETVHGAQMAMMLLDYMEGRQRTCNPDVITYNTCIHGWAKCRAKESGERAESILRRMKGSSDHEICKPNIRTYSCCIDAWCCSDSPSAARRAHALLNELESIYDDTGDSNIQPNAFTYASVINAYARSRQSEKKAASALQILKHMKEIYDSGKNPLAKPTIVHYNSVLNACATTIGSLGRSRDDRQLGQPPMTGSRGFALGVVRLIYKELTSEFSDVCPDHFTYGTVLKACANHMSPIDDEVFVRQIFEKCCEDGQVSFGVLFQLRQAATVELYRDLIPSEAIDRSNDHFIIEKIPPSWSRNVKLRRNTGHSIA